MKPRFIVCIALMIAASCGWQAPVFGQARNGFDLRQGTFSPIIKQVAPSVVNIYSTKTVRVQPHPLMEHPFFREFFEVDPGEERSRTREEQNLGSGVIVTADGYILTNNHVIEGADDIRVVLLPNGREYNARIIGTDPPTEIAVLKIEGEDLPIAQLGDSDALDIGDIVLAIGNPFGVGQTVTMGIVSATGRGGFGIVDYEDFIQTDASISPGNSGGPLVNARAEVVGVNTAMLSAGGGAHGIGFAVPINMARGVMERIIEEGRVVRGYLGVGVQPLTPELAQQFGLKETTGALVSHVVPRGPAAVAGLRPGDVIVEFNEEPVADARLLRLMAARTRPGSRVTMTVIREGQEQTFAAVLRELPQPERDVRQTEREPIEPETTENVLDGVAVTNLDNQGRKKFGIPPAVQGALVIRVDPLSPAHTAGVRPGNVIMEINRQPVRNASEAVKISRRAGDEPALLRIWSEGNTLYITVGGRASLRR